MGVLAILACSIFSEETLQRAWKRLVCACMTLRQAGCHEKDFCFRAFGAGGCFQVKGVPLFKEHKTSLNGQSIIPKDFQVDRSHLKVKLVW